MSVAAFASTGLPHQLTDTRYALGRRGLLKVPVEVPTDGERNEHDSECNRNLHGVVEHSVAHDSSPFTGDIRKLSGDQP
jgi:hypothetical protein